jgi:hypothetical protein
LLIAITTSRMNKKSRLWCRVFGHVSVRVYSVVGGSYSRFGRLVYVLVCVLGRFDRHTTASCHWCIFGEYICVDLETGIFISILSYLSISLNVFLILFLFINEFLLIQSLELWGRSLCLRSVALWLRPYMSSSCSSFACNVSPFFCSFELYSLVNKICAFHLNKFTYSA